jgi:hypothetical protein
MLYVVSDQHLAQESMVWSELMSLLKLVTLDYLLLYMLLLLNF